MSKLVKAYVTAAQKSESGKPLRVGMCCKHFAAYDVEDLPTPRYRFDANVSRQMLWETYLPAFEACVKEAKASGRRLGAAPSAWEARQVLSGPWRHETTHDGVVLCPVGSV